MKKKLNNIYIICVKTKCIALFCKKKKLHKTKEH